jgi:uncharacterized protein with NRDE domain
MCTCSWLRVNGGYDLMFNRDEQWSRQPALLPRLLVRNGARYLAPIDADAGGTWLGVNAFGLSIGLLNRYQDMQPASASVPGAAFISRGVLVRNLLDSRMPLEVRERVESLELARFQPFTLIVITPDAPALLLEWDSRTLAVDSAADAQMPLASSSFDTATALAYRKDLWQRTMQNAATTDKQRLFHAAQEPGRAAYGPCMRRDDAHTVSFSWIRVRPEQITFEYAPSALCDAATVAPFSVSIKPVSAFK